MVSHQTRLSLRPYQVEALDAIAQCHARGINRPAVVSPTGSGKTVMFSHMAARSDARTLVIAHTRELVEQAAAVAKAIAPTLPVGIDMAARHAEPSDRLVVGSVQTLSTDSGLRRWPPHAFGLVVVDECHRAIAQSYIRVLDHYGCLSDAPDATPAVGFTATLARGDKMGLGGVWQTVAFERSIAQMVADGYLVYPRGIAVPMDSLDLSDVPVSDGDYTASGLEQALIRADFAEKIVAAYAGYGGGRSMLVFTPTVATARLAAAALARAGYSAEAVWGMQDRDERTSVVTRFRAGAIRILCNCSVLTEGFDAPIASGVILARASKSATRLIQMIGRGLRTYPGKDDCRILDMVGATLLHKVRTLVDLEDDGTQAPDLTREAADEEDSGGGGGGARARVIGEVGKEIDLFAVSDSVWLQTRGGRWFIPTARFGDIFLIEWPSRDGYSIGVMPRDGAPIPLGRASELTLAMAIGEEHAHRLEREYGGLATTRRNASWRRSQQPTRAQIGAAARLDIDVPPGATRGDVSDLISVQSATWRIDTFFDRRDRHRG